jgi:antitoxin (DNA-binding transcriptional repressor) of toxin-antitoxin stability system
MVDADVPPVFRTLVGRFGGPVPVEEARSRWSDLVSAAEAGTVTLITLEGRQWAALVPMSEVADPVAWLPMWPLSEARARLGRLIWACDGGRAQVLTRHRRPVAAVIGATVLLDRPVPADRLGAEALLLDGYRIVLQFDPGDPGRMGYEGEVAQEPEPECYTATAVDRTDTTVAVGIGPTLGEALLRLAAPDAVDLVDEPPF